MIKSLQRGVFTSVLLLFASLMLGVTFSLSPTGRVVPLTICIPTVILLAVQLTIDTLPGFASKHRLLSQKDVFGVDVFRSRLSSKRDVVPAEDARGRREAIAFGWLLLLGGLIYAFGLLIALPFYCLLYMKRRAGEGWLLSIATSGIMFVILYELLIGLLRAPLYEGRFWALLGL